MQHAAPASLAAVFNPTGDTAKLSLPFTEVEGRWLGHASVQRSP